MHSPAPRTDQSPAVQTLADQIAARKAKAAGIRSRARGLFDQGANGVQVASFISEKTDDFLLELCVEAAGRLDPASRQIVEKHCAVIAVGGSGRGELCPWSDADLLFLFQAPARDVYIAFASDAVRNCWDSGLKLGHSVRSISDALLMARDEPQFSTSLVRTRTLWGSPQLEDQLRRRVCKRAIRRRVNAFVDQAVTSRLQERNQFGEAVKLLEPDVKRSPGGLRDIHLIQWIGFAHYGVSELESLRLRGAMSRADERTLADAHEFLTHTRIDLHFEAGRAQDVLNRDEQLRLATKYGFTEQDGRRPVEHFMQQYFQHSTAVAEISQRFVKRHQSATVLQRAIGRILAHRFDGVCILRPDGVDVQRRHRKATVESLEGIMRLYRSAMLYDTELDPDLVELVRESTDSLPRDITIACGKLFRQILRGPGDVGRTLRDMYASGVLEVVIPEMTHVRGLLQFNQYHSFTVDEHTFRAIEAVGRFEDDNSPVGAAYRAIRHKATLRLALLLHDLGKGFEEDHSELGRRIAERVGPRLTMSENKREMLEFLIEKHLRMSHLAFRRDTTDQNLLMGFAREVGSPERLRMLYVLTAADVTAVGPGAWTDWKSELMSDLYNRTMFILSGRPYRFLEQERIESIRRHVLDSVEPVSDSGSPGEWKQWLERQLEQFPVHYLTTETADRIARDLDVIQHLQSNDIVAEGRPLDESGTVEYHVITRGHPADGCFHRIAGVLTAGRLEILSAQICTTDDGVVVDSFRVVDRDFSDTCPPERIAQVVEQIRQVLKREQTVETLFQRGARFGDSRPEGPVSDLPMRVVIDNDSADAFTVIDVFAHDRPGLLYVVARAIHELNLSVALAKISTHLDQVVDVFFVTDSAGRKIADARTRTIRDSLIQTLTEFERDGKQQYVR